MAKVTILVNGQPTVVEETTPGLFGKLGYTYASGGSSGSSAPSPAPSPSTPAPSSSGPREVTVLVNGTPTKVMETTPGLFGQLGYQYVSGGSTAPTTSQGAVSPTGETYTFTDLGNGNVLVNPGNLTMDKANAAARYGYTGGGGATPATALPNQETEEDVSLTQILSGANLSEDQKALIQQIYDTLSTNDVQNAGKITNAISAAMQFSDPYFKAQARIAIDTLQRGFGTLEGNLGEQEVGLKNTLDDLRADIAAGMGDLSFAEQQELKSLERTYDQELRNTRDQLASTGFTSSSRRARKEDLMEESFGDLRESTTRSFSRKREGLENQLTRSERDAALEIERLRRLTEEGKLDLLRETEGAIGTDALKNLPQLSGRAPVGGIAGSISQEQARDALSFANSFVF